MAQLHNQQAGYRQRNEDDCSHVQTHQVLRHKSYHVSLLMKMHFGLWSTCAKTSITQRLCDEKGSSALTYLNAAKCEKRNIKQIIILGRKKLFNQ